LGHPQLINLTQQTIEAYLFGLAIGSTLHRPLGDGLLAYVYLPANFLHRV